LQFLLNTARFSSPLRIFNHIQPPSPYQHRPFLRPTTPSSAT
jgi:hypothetical protein